MSPKDEDKDPDLESLGSDSDSDIEGSGEDQSSAGDVAEKIKAQLAKRETTQVFRLRLLVFLVLLMAAAAVSVIVYFVTSGSETDEYKTQYEGASKLVLETFVDIVEAKLAVVSSLGVALIAHGVDNDSQRWPYVTISAFQQRASTARAQSGSLYVQVNPLVNASQREQWELFAVGEDADWIRRDIAYQADVGLFDFDNETSITVQEGVEANEDISDEKPWPIWYRNEEDKVVTDLGAGPYMPTWQTSPVFYDGRESNENILRSFRTSSEAARSSYETGNVVMGQFLTAPPGGIESDDSFTALYALLLSTFKQQVTEYEGDPISQVFFPIFNGFSGDRKAVAVMVAWVHWGSYFRRVLPISLRGIFLVLNDSCGSTFTYKIDGEFVTVLGSGDLHNTAYDNMKRSASLSTVNTIADGTRHGLPINHDHCTMVMDVYPSDTFHNLFNTNTPILMTCAVAIIFIFTAFMFLFYDRLVERRQQLVMQKAIETTAVVASLFPENVRDRLIQSNNINKGGDSKQGGTFMNPNNRVKGFISNGGQDDDGLQPIADLFPRCTVLFSDLAGFTAWSSSREPAQVFILLQTVYQAFDIIAKRRKVFKVETIGDSYLAVTGLPEPMENHAGVMVRFAWDCMLKLNEITKELELKLGPDTGDLAMRFGLHSGPVTAGVLRGERARFQLFGDTVNTASRMESTGQRGKIQVSHTTAAALIESGKEHWMRKRTDEVKAKGKGVMNTFWVNPTNKKGSSTGTSVTDTVETDDAEGQPSLVGDDVEKPLNQRLVAWMTDLFVDDIKKIVHARELRGLEENGDHFKYIRPAGATFLDEVKDVIKMPEYNAHVAENMDGYAEKDLPPVVMEQLREYVTAVASLYRNNPFHNFEHACHVTMSVKKLLKRVVNPDMSEEELAKLTAGNKNIASHLHELTHGLASDPLALLAITLSALIHDVDHRGVSNMQLMTEAPELAAKFDNKSVAEQNSMDLAWGILMESRFESLRACLFHNEADLFRFRQLIVNVVLATDIFDKELNDLRKARWAEAFRTADPKENANLRATIVIEHIIQASDVSHTMQHWHVYQKWNKCLFTEMYKAYKAGRMAKDPTEFWFQGEIGFFDNYVIPLAKKLKDCGVFGVSSDEYLNYAVQNRMEWEERGQEMVEELVAELNSKKSSKARSSMGRSSVVNQERDGSN